MIVILGDPYTDATPGHLKRLIEARGADVVVFDTRRFPETVDLDFDLDRAMLNGASLAEADAVFIRQMFGNPVRYGAEMDPRMRENWYAMLSAFDEKNALVGSVLGVLEAAGIPIVNPGNSIAEKPLQLWTLRRAGLRVPRTLVTNSPESVRRFRAECDRVIYKTLTGGASTQLLRDEDLDRLELLREAPVLFQEFVGGTNVRVYVVGGDIVLSVAMLTGDAYDFRRDQRGIERIELAPGVREACLRATRACHLEFTSIDLKMPDPREEEYVILECNSSTYIPAIDHLTGDAVGRALADYLVGKAAACPHA